MEITTDFLRDEVRSGFYIPTAIKQAWATQLIILSEIDRICRKYNITYFADWGTLLGTVRHGGYIPWDDDLDISMKREDYIRFRQVADKELPKEFAIHDFERKEDHWLFLARVVNRNQICFEEEHLDKYYNFPYIATVDIFVLDYLYKDEAEERKRCEEVKYLIALADIIVNGKLSSQARMSELSKIEDLYHTKIDNSKNPREIGIELYKLAQQQMARVPEEESERIGQIFPWILKGAKGLPKRYYEKAIRLPFEMTTMPVPECYHQVLQNRYGNYFQVHKVWDGHDYPYFEGQRKNLQAEADFELPQFTFDKSMLRQADAQLDKSNSLKGIAKECLAELDGLVATIESALKDGMYEDGLAILPECQQLAIDLGTLIENVKGEDNLCSKAVVGELEQFCETLFAIYQVLADEGGIDAELLSGELDKLQQKFSSVESAVSLNIFEKKEILFVTTGAKQWKGLESLYNAALEESMNDVYVVPVPVMPKDVFGQVRMTNEELAAELRLEDYPEELKLSSWNTYSLELHQPDVIFIQDPYDGENDYLTVSQQFYARNLQRYTEKLVYVPAYAVEEFGEKDVTALYNMKHYVTAPGIVCADIVIVQSEGMKKLYVEKLTEFAGNETRELWEKKLLPLGLPVMDILNTEKLYSKERKLLFCIGCNAISETEGDFETELQDKLSVIREHYENLKVGICMYPGDMNAWNTAVGESAVHKVEKLIEDCLAEPWCELCDLAHVDMKDIVLDYDAYYGSPSPLVHLFNNEKKPVMLSCY